MTSIRHIGLGLTLWMAVAVPALSGSRLIFPRVPASNDRFTGIAILNPGSDAAAVTLKAYMPDGTLVGGSGVTNPMEVSLGAGKQYAKVAGVVFGGMGAADYAWIEVTSPAGGLTGFFLEGTSDGRVMDGSDLVATGTDLVLPLVEMTTEISVVNPEPAGARVVVDFLRADGTVSTSHTADIEARGALQGAVAKLVDGTAEDVVGLRVRSNQPVACFGFYSGVGGDGFAVMAAQDATVPSRTLYVPQFLDGGGWGTTVGVRNVASSPTLVTITALDADGKLLSSPVVTTNPVTVPLPESGSMRGDLRAMFGFSGAGLQTGWLRIDAGETAIRGYVDIGVGKERMLTAARLVGDTRFVFSHQVTTAPYFTSLALLNSGELTANVEVASLDQEGKVLGRYQGILKAGQRLTAAVDQLIPAARGASGGAVIVKSDVPLMASEIFGTETLAALSAISPQAVPASFDPTAGMPRVAVAPPLAVVETGKSVRFAATGGSGVEWLLNGVKGGTAETGSLTAAGVYTAPKTAPKERTLTVQAVSGSLSAGSSVDVVQRESLVGGLSVVTAVAYAEGLQRFYVAEQQLLSQEGSAAEKRDAAGTARVLERTPAGDVKPVVAFSLETISKMVPFVSGNKTYLLLAGLERGLIYRFDVASQELATVATGLSRPSSMALDTFSGDLLVAESGTGQIVVVKRKAFDPAAREAPEGVAESGFAGEVSEERHALQSVGVHGVAFDPCTGAIYAVSTDGVLREYLGNRVRTVATGLNHPGQVLVLLRTGVSPCAQGVSLLVTEPDRLLQIFPQSGGIRVFVEDLQDLVDVAFLSAGNPYIEEGAEGVLLGDSQSGSNRGRALALIFGKLYRSNSGYWLESDIKNNQQTGRMPFSDARGDTFETSLTKDATLAVIEILSVSGQRVGQTYILTLTFNQPVLPLSAGAANSLSGRIDVDTGAGGVESGASAFNPFRQPVGVGVTATIDLGAATITIAGPPPQTSPVEMHFVDNVVTVAIPLSLLDITKSRIVVVVGNRLEATDVAPNERSIGTKDDPIDQPTISLAKASASGLESVGAVRIQVKLSKPASTVVTVGYAATGGTATGNGVDYSFPAGTLVFRPGETAKTITLTVVNDSRHEFDETVVVGLSNASNGVVGEASSFTYTIIDDDPIPSIQFSSTTSAGTTVPYTMPIAVTLSSTTSDTASVQCRVTGGTAKEGTDFLLSGGNVVIQPGQLTQTVNLVVLDCPGCQTPRPELTVQLTLSEAAGAVLGGRVVHTHTIPLTPAKAPPTVQFQQATSSGLESVTTASLTVTLSNPSSSTVTVQYDATGGTATRFAAAGAPDYALTPGTLTFAPGVTSQSLSFTVTDDPTIEQDETVIVSLSSPTGATLGAPSSHTYAILNNDFPTVTFQTTGSSGDESVASVPIAITLSAAAPYPINVQYAATGGTATGGGVDYTLAPGTLTFAAGITTQNISLTVVDDATYELAENVVITLSSPSGATLGSQITFDYSIVDNDPIPTVAFVAATGSGLESATAPVLTVVLSNPSYQTVTVDYAPMTDVTATLGADYTLTPGTLTFPPGTTSRTVPITIINDALYEGDEYLQVDLLNPTNATLGTQTSYTYTIINDDSMPTISFAAPASTAPAAGSGNAYTFYVPIVLSAASDLYTSVDVTRGTNPPTPVYIPNGDTVYQFPLTITYFDTVGTTITLTLSNAGSATLASPTTHTITIVAPPAVQFQSAGATVANVKQTVNIGVTLSAAQGVPLTVQYFRSGSNLDNAGSGVNFGPDRLPRNRHVPARPDHPDDPSAGAAGQPNSPGRGAVNLNLLLSNPNPAQLGSQTGFTLTINP